MIKTQPPFRETETAVIFLDTKSEIGYSKITAYGGVIVLTNAQEAELKKLIRRYKIFRGINTFLYCFAALLLLLVLLEMFDIIDLPFYEQRSRRSLRIFLNAWVGIPIFFIERHLKKIDARITELEFYRAGVSLDSSTEK